MRILLIVDKKNNWSIHNRAKKIKEYIPDWHIDIMERVDVTPEVFRYYYRRYDIVHFCMGGIVEYKNWFDKFKGTMTTTLSSHGCVNGVFQDLDKLDFIFENSAKVVALNHRLAKCYDNTVLIPNGVDTKIFKPKRKKKLVVGFCGIRTNSKGYSLAKKACNILKKHVEFIDDGNNHPQEYKKQEDMKSFYHKIDVLLLPSENEGSSNVVLEALACGKPVICTDVGNAEELIGVTIVDRTVDDIVLGIQEFIPHTVIQEEWTWKVAVNKYKKMWVDVYKKNKDIGEHYYDRKKSYKT